MTPLPKNALMLAPMVGITNRAFRTLVAELGGPDRYVTEMASAEAFYSHAQYEDCYTDARPAPAATSVQFYARSEAAMEAACRELGRRDEALRPDGIDLNFGCSAPHIRKSGGGSAWSEDPEGAAALVAAARSAWPGTLSAKLRMGPDDDYPRLLDFCAGLAAAGLDFITLHPRTDSQKFKRRARHDITARLARDLAIPVVANGDIGSAEAARGLFAGGAGAVMLGREAVRRPWIFAVLRAELSGAEPLAGRPIDRLSVAGQPLDRLAVALRFLELDAAFLPEKWQLETARRFFDYYCEPLSFAHHIKYRTMNSPSLGAMRSTLEEYFGQVPADLAIADREIAYR
ncbi:tRNA-dihydrouridine synthase family protein [bacterium]|nr:tRNA-dihydrouridine synthase family protein [bacterium]